MCHAQRYERSAERVDTRAGHYRRRLHTQAGEVELKVPKLRRQTFETAIIERYRRRDISVEEAIVQMYLAGVSVRRVEDITEALWGTRVSSGTVSKLNQKVYKHIERWRNQPLYSCACTPDRSACGSRAGPGVSGACGTSRTPGSDGPRPGSPMRRSPEHPEPSSPPEPGRRPTATVPHSSMIE